MGLFNKKELQRIAELEALLQELGADEYLQVKKKCEQLTQEYQSIQYNCQSKQEEF